MNEASTLTITPKRSSSRDVGTSSYRYHTATYPPASVSANRRTNDTIFVASMCGCPNNSFRLHHARSITGASAPQTPPSLKGRHSYFLSILSDAAVITTSFTCIRKKTIRVTSQTNSLNSPVRSLSRPQ
ncbi:hypothetical protein TNCV_3174211 [Trichonephila clavipes]|nr:hypothetical protein TNCV_3174211 [Trichonephila clavipes]